MVYGPHQGEQVHLGAALWNRGNVIIGLYGQWHGPDNDDRRHVTMDLGLVVSSDALAGEDGFYHLPVESKLKHSALAQGQGFENIGDETLFWYAPWPESISDGVRLATWQRDRLGFLQAFEPVNGRAPDNRHLISAPIDLQGKPAQVALNADGLTEDAQVAVTILDQFFRPLTGYPAEDCLPLASGLHRTVAWRSR